MSKRYVSDSVDFVIRRNVTFTQSTYDFSVCANSAEFNAEIKKLHIRILVQLHSVDVQIPSLSICKMQIQITLLMF